MDARRGIIESKCDPTRLTSLATLIGAQSLVYKWDRMSKLEPRDSDKVITGLKEAVAFAKACDSEPSDFPAEAEAELLMIRTQTNL